MLFAATVAGLTTVFWSIWYAAVGGLAREPALLTEEIWAEVAGALAVLVAAYGLRRFVDRRSLASLGLGLRRPWLRLLALGLGFGAGMQALVFAFEASAGATRAVAFGSFLPDVRLIAAALAVFVAGALLEEMTFRGYLFQNFWEAFGLVPAVIITSLLFASFHFGNPGALAAPLPTIAGLLVFAIWASCSLLWTRSLWLPVGAHIAWNLFEGPVFGFPVSGLHMPVQTVIVQHTTGPDWLTGGAFGPEAGLSSIVAMGVGLALLRWLYVRGAFEDSPDVAETYDR